jgi:hypothetical protein
LLFTVTKMKPFCQVTKRYSQIAITLLISSNSFIPLLPATADPLPTTTSQNSAAPGDIENQATAQFTDSIDNSLQNIVSDLVKVTVAEVAGISATASGYVGTRYPASIVYFDFTIKNEGNDQTQIFIPAAPAIATIGGNTVIAGQLQVIEYTTVTPITNVVTTVAVTKNNLVNTTTGSATGSLMAGGLATGTLMPNGGSVPAGGYIKVRIPITIPAGTANNTPIVMTLGNTAGQISNVNTPYIIGANGAVGTGNDLYTKDNGDGLNGETSNGPPANGDGVFGDGNIANHRQEASATLTIAVDVPKVSIAGKVWDDANNSAINTFTNITGVNPGDPAESGAVLPVATPIYAVLVKSDNTVLASTQVINNGTNGAAGTNGTYTFSNIDGFQTGLYIILSSTDLSLGTSVTAATPVLPSAWTATSPLIHPITPDLTSANVTGIDFGIEQLPTAVGGSNPIQANPTGTGTVIVPATLFTTNASDPDGTVTAYKITAFPSNATSITINGTLYFLANFPATGVTLTPTQLAGMSIDPIDGAVTVSIPFQAIDNASKASTATAASLAFSGAGPVDPLSISGTIWNDKDNSGSVSPYTNIRTGTGASLEVGTDTIFGTSTTHLYAILVDMTTPAGVVLDSQMVNPAPSGTYSFSNVPANTLVRVLLSPTTVALNAPLPTTGVTPGWTATTPADSGIFNTGAASITGKDFGVLQKAKLVLIKRITRINNQVINPNDGIHLDNITPIDTFNNVGNWPTGYLIGSTNAGKIKPGDTIEYTIYFLNNQGSGAVNVKICDPIRGDQIYDPGSISLNLTSDPTAVGTSLSDAIDPTSGDRAHVYASGGKPAHCNVTATEDLDPGVAISITGTGANPLTQADLLSVPGATGVATPASYGLFRFRTKVKL